MNIKGRHFLKLLDFTPEEINGLVELAARLKADKKAGVEDKAGKGLFVTSLAINGGAIIVCGIFAHVFCEKKISFLASSIQSTIPEYLEFAVVSYILGIIIVLAAVGLVLYTVFGKKKKPIPTLR